MDITLIGWIFIILCIYALIKSRNFLLDLLVFSSVFTAAAVINIESTTTGIQPFYFVGVVWIITVAIKQIKKGMIKERLLIHFKENKLIKSLCMFGVIIILSEFWILIFNNKFTFVDTKTSELMTASFSKSNITQPMFLLFMVVIAILLCIELNTKSKIIRCMKVFGIATIFALVWGIAQFCMFYMNLSYPDWIFNNNISYLQLFYQMIYGLKRVNSVALEPSTFALNIIVFLPTVIILWIVEYKIFKDKNKSKILLSISLFLAMICGILTTSTTAYIGIALIIIIVTIYILFLSQKDGELRKNKRKIILFYLFMILSIIFIVLLATKIFNMYWGTLWDALMDITIKKKNLETGSERGNAILTSINILKASPILGIGFGTFRSLDLTTNLLSNMGVLGLLSYLYVIYISIKNILLNIKKSEFMALALGVTLVVSTISLMISIPDLMFGYYWILIVVVNNYFIKDKEEKQIENRN